VHMLMILKSKMTIYFFFDNCLLGNPFNEDDDSIKISRMLLDLNSPVNELETKFEMTDMLLQSIRENLNKIGIIIESSKMENPDSYNLLSVLSNHPSEVNSLKTKEQQEALRLLEDSI